MKRSFILLFLGVVIAAMAVAVFTSPAAAQGCTDPSGKPAPCPPGPSEKEKRPTKTPIYVPVKRPTQTPTDVPTFTPTNIPSFTPTKVPTITPTPALNIPPLYPHPYLYPGGGAYPYKNPPHDPTCIICPQTWQWWAGGGVVFLIALGGFLFLVFRGPRSLGSAGQPGGSGPLPGSDENATIMPPGDGLGNLPFMERGGHENLTIATPGIGDLDGEGKTLPAIQRGAHESVTISVHDAGDLDGEQGNLPYMERGGRENLTIATPGLGDLDGEGKILPAIQRGANESVTITVHDAGDLDGESGNPSAIDWGDHNNPGGVQRSPGPPVKPPTPNLDDKPGGGTL